MNDSRASQGTRRVSTGTEDSTIRRLVPGVAAGFSKRAKTQKRGNARYRVAMTRVLFSIRTDSIWGGSWNLSRF
jgi:hypothetical protein